jgi:hypothetical protein
VDAPENDGNASMPEQVKRPNPWRKKKKKMMMIIIIIFQKPVEVIQVLLKSDKRSGYFTLRRLYINIILE